MISYQRAGGRKKYVVWAQKSLAKFRNQLSERLGRGAVETEFLCVAVAGLELSHEPRFYTHTHTHVWESWSNLNSEILHWPLHQKLQDYIKALSKKKKANTLWDSMKTQWTASWANARQLLIAHPRDEHIGKAPLQRDGDQLLLRVKLSCRTDFFGNLLWSFKFSHEHFPNLHFICYVLKRNKKWPLLSTASDLGVT